MLIYIVAGLTVGSIYGLAAVGLVLTYKTTGIFNFAYGAQASATAFLFYFLNAQHGLPWPVAAAICVALMGPGFGWGFELLARRLAAAPLSLKVVGTLGVLLAIEGLLDLLYPPGSSIEVSQFLPVSAFNVMGTPVQIYRVIILAIGVGGVVALTVFLRRSRTGVAMRAIVDDPELLDITGVSPIRVRRYAWMIGSTTAAVAGVLLAPLVTIDATTLTLLVVTAFGAAAVGKFTSLPLTYIGGLAIGIGQALLQEYITNSAGLLGGLSASLPFILLFALLVASPRLRRPSTARILLRSGNGGTWRAPMKLRRISLVSLVVLLVLVPEFAGTYLVDWTQFVAYIIVFLSLGLLVRVSGQVSLAQVSFMAIGVCAFSDLTVVHHWPWLPALVVAALIAAPLGALLAVPAIRFPGLYLALATLGFGILLQQMFYSQGYMFGPYDLGTKVPMPSASWLGLVGPRGYYYVVLVAAVLVAAAVALINQSRLGRLLRAMGDSADGLASCGTSINVSRVLVFTLGASLAAVAGILDAAALGVVGSESYAPVISLQLFVLIMITVGDVPWYAVLAAAAEILLPAYIGVSASIGYALTLVFGLSAVAFAVTPSSSRQLPRWLRDAVDRRFKPIAQSAAADVVPDAPQPVTRLVSDPPQHETESLSVEDITVRFGGLVAADGISLRAQQGKITGLIGPNGAGKTTVFNACAGLLRPESGHVYLDRRLLDGLRPPSRARLGMGRTFQHMELFDSLSVWDNVSLGREGGYAGWNPLDHLIARKSQRIMSERRTAEALNLCGIAALADEKVAALSTGQRRLVELARCLSGPFHVLLLDEPSSGLDRVETERFGDILLRVIAERDVAILLIEHDMSLVNRVCDYIYAIDFGENLFEGTAAEVRSSPVVRAAYLGQDVTGDSLSSLDARPAVPRAVEPSLSASAGLTKDGPLLEFDAITSGYGSTTVLRDVSFNVRSGQVVALLGPNGAGKTTLLRTATGILRPSGGRVLLEGSDVSRQSPHERAAGGICLIPEGRGLFRSLSVYENLRLQISSGTTDLDDGVERVLGMFPVLGSRMHQLAGRLSGGEQQMLALSRAYLTQPKVILLDEVSMGLAPIVVDQMFQAMSDLARTGVAMLVVEQYVSRALEMADSAVLLNQGQVSYNGPPSELDEETVLRGYLGAEDSLATFGLEGVRDNAAR